MFNRGEKHAHENNPQIHLTYKNHFFMEFMISLLHKRSI